MINRKAIGTLLLAAVVIIGTTASSGGCGSNPDTGAPQVGAGGVESEGSSGGSGEPPASSGDHTTPKDTPNPSHDAQPRGSATPNEPSEPPDEGSDPCIAHLSELGVGSRVSATLTVGSCDPQPKQYGGTLELQYATGELPNLNWHKATVIPIYSANTTQVISAPCQDTYWVVVYETGGRDASGKSFAHTYSRFYEENGIPRKANCP